MTNSIVFVEYFTFNFLVNKIFYIYIYTTIFGRCMQAKLLTQFFSCDEGYVQLWNTTIGVDAHNT